MRLERLQHRAARLVTGALFRSPTDKLLQELGWSSLRRRREINSLLHMYKMTQPRFCTPQYLTDILPASRDTVTRCSLRNASSITLPTNRLTSYKNSYIPSTIRAWNILPQRVRNKPSLPLFKRAVTQEYGVRKPSPFFSYGSKWANTLHTRLRLGVSELNAQLFKFHSTKTNSPHCICGHLLETTEHFLLNCPSYSKHRITMENFLRTIIPSFFFNRNRINRVDTLLSGRGLSEKDGLAVARAVQ